MTRPLNALMIIALLTVSATQAAPSAADEEQPSNDESRLVSPDDLEYQGAFRLPRSTTKYSWGYGGWALTYYPGGDPSGPGDGYPGSLYGIGHDWYQLVSEITIPKPVISETKDPNELPIAHTLQPFADITDGGLEKARGDKIGGLVYLPKQPGQETDKIYLTIFEYYNAAGRDNNGHGWAELDLSDPQPKGLWHLGRRGRPEFHSTKTGNYLFDIPTEWADQNVGGKLLAAGRSRTAGAFGSSQGPTLYAFGPYQDGNPPERGSELDAVALLYYPKGGIYPDYSECDRWDGGAWLTKGTSSAVVFTGSKGLGETHYGHGRAKDCYPSKGYHCTPYEGQFVFYDPRDLALVAKGKKKPTKVQPYAVMSVNEYLFPSCRYEIGATAFDRDRGILYVIQKDADKSKSGHPLVHVFRLAGD